MGERTRAFSDYNIEIYTEKRLFGTRLVVNFDRGAHFESFVEYEITKAQAQRIRASEETAWAVINELLDGPKKPIRRG